MPRGRDPPYGVTWPATGHPRPLRGPTTELMTLTNTLTDLQGHVVEGEVARLRRSVHRSQMIQGAARRRRRAKLGM